jgi:hypothetical protein
MFGYIESSNKGTKALGAGYAIVANKIFELFMSDYFVSKDANAGRMENAVSNSMYYEIIKNNAFNMELALTKFAEHYTEIFAEKDAPFLERHGRLIFLSFLRPLINGQGFYHIESPFTDQRRMDIIVDFGREQFIVELKLWKGEAGMDKAYEQLQGYMQSKGAKRGYLLTFDFRKVKDEQKSAWVDIGDRRIFSVVV